MKVYVLPADAYGCGHYRVAWPADVLRRQGFDVHIIPPNAEHGSGFLAKSEKTGDGKEQLVSVTVPEDANVIVLQRPAHPMQPDMIRMMRANGIAVVIDMDDDMSCIARGNVAYKMYQHNSSSLFSSRYAMESCKAATMVTATTPALIKKYARPGAGVVIDNYVPQAYLSYPTEEADNFGWAGTTLSHPDDLQQVGSAFQRLIEDGHKFQVVGAPSKVKQYARLKAEPDFTGAIGFGDWARTLAERLDVGTIPLAPTEFNKSKSRLKGIEYMSVGVPWVASPREEYRRLHRDSGCGFLAETPKEWYAHLKRLLTDEVLRKEQAEAGRAYMANQTYEANAWRWAEAWTKAAQNP